MKRWVVSLLLLGLGLAQHAFAAGIARIPDGDCITLAAAMNTPPAQEQALIVLARNGTYACGPLSVSANIEVDGAGATLVEYQNFSVSNKSSGLVVNAGASLVLRNVIIGQSPQAIAKSAAVTGPGPKFCCGVTATVVTNAGSLTMDSVTLTGLHYSQGISFFVLGVVGNSGHMVLRNVTVVDNDYSGQAPALFANSGTLEISHSTLVTTPQAYAQALLSSNSGGVISIANSVLSNNGSVAAPICASGSTGIISLGGNVFTDSSCGLGGANDRLVADARTLDLANHGAAVPTLALNYDSPAISNGLLANCEAADARGVSRNSVNCDSGAYEVGGGNGKLVATGMSGLFFNPQNNGHYVSVQRLYGNQALVIWNTFDQNGVPAWLYGVGSLIGGINRIAVDPVAQNVGGVLQPGGDVIGANAVAWGAMELTFDDCYSALLRYASPSPQFGSGETRLQRLAFLDGVNCAR